MASINSGTSAGERPVTILPSMAAAHSWQLNTPPMISTESPDASHPVSFLPETRSAASTRRRF